MSYLFYCYIDGSKITKHPLFKKFKRGDFIGSGANENSDVRPTKHYKKAEIYSDYKMISDCYEDFCMADMFWIVPIKPFDSEINEFWSWYGPEITLHGEEQIVKISPDGFKFEE